MFKFHFEFSLSVETDDSVKRNNITTSDVINATETLVTLANLVDTASKL